MHNDIQIIKAMMRNNVLMFVFTIAFAFVGLTPIEAQRKTVMFDLSHGQCQDTYPGHEYYTDILPGYEDLMAQVGARLVVNDSLEITKKSLKNVDALLMLSPLSNDLQKNISDAEKVAIVDFVKHGGRLIFFVDDEHRVNLKEYGANDITRVFGVELGDDIKDIPGNCGAISFENEIFSRRYEIPYSGARAMKGGIPSSVCLEGGYLHSSYVKLKNGGRIFVAADTMVGQLMGYPDGVRNVHNKMETRWWGKDSNEFMRDLLVWALEK
jgi:hypothetical protein